MPGKEPLELAERRFDAVMRDPRSTDEQRFKAVVELACRAYPDFNDADGMIRDADRIIQAWMDHEDLT